VCPAAPNYMAPKNGVGKLNWRNGCALMFRRRVKPFLRKTYNSNFHHAASSFERESRNRKQVRWASQNAFTAPWIQSHLVSLSSPPGGTTSCVDVTLLELTIL
jgi:hypothetical protein